MITPLIIIALVTLPLAIAALIAKLKGTELAIRKYATWGLGIAFLFFATGHFVETKGMVEMLPTWIPLRPQIVYATGLLELAIGAALFVSQLQNKATRAAILVLVIFFPANIYAALNAIGLGGHQWGPIYLLIRGPLQLFLISWAYFLCLKNN